MLKLQRPVVQINVNIVSILLESLQAAEHTDTLVQLLLARDDDRNITCFIATERSHLPLLEKLW